MPSVEMESVFFYKRTSIPILLFNIPTGWSVATFDLK